jgi:hypothetical protein
MSGERVVRIGCSSAFWGDSAAGARQLVERSSEEAPLHYLVADYLAEVTMGLLARGKAADKSKKGKGGMGGGGFVSEFVKAVWKPLAKEITSKGIRVVTNAGGMNPRGLKEAIEQECKKQGITGCVVACVEGDDIHPRLSELRDGGKLKQFEVAGQEDAFPADRWFMSSNAYLGAEPVVAALSAGAHVRVVLGVFGMRSHCRAGGGDRTMR